MPTCSSPVRHGRDANAAPFDLHALGTPPALILSQDQTLHHDLACLKRPDLPGCSHPPARIRLRTSFLFRAGWLRTSQDSSCLVRLHSVFRAALPRFLETPVGSALLGRSPRQTCEANSPQAANPLGNSSIEAPTALAWNSTAVNRCSGAQPLAASRPQRPTDSTAPVGDRQGISTVNVAVPSGTELRLTRVRRNSDYYTRNIYVRPPRTGSRGASKQHASPGDRHHVVAIH